MSFFWVIFTLSWSLYAAFVGLTSFLYCHLRGPQLVPYLGVSALIVVPTLIGLCDQSIFEDLNGFGYMLSLSTMAFLFVAWLMSAHLPHRLGRICRSISAVTFFIAFVWTLGSPPGLFLPVLFCPDSEVFADHLLFGFLFLLLSIATFFGLASTKAAKG